MADDFTGTNSDKIDRLVSRFLALEASQRVVGRMAVVFVPSLIGLFCYLVISNHSVALRMERQAEKVEQIERRLTELEKQQRDTNDLLRQLLARKS